MFLWVATFISQNCKADSIEECKRLLEQYKCKIMDYKKITLSPLVINITFSHVNQEVIKEIINHIILSKKIMQIDYSFQLISSYSKPKKMIVFDGDMTFYQMEIINHLGKLAQVEDQITKITNQAMQGEIDFTTALLQRVKMLTGLKNEQLNIMTKNIPYTPGIDLLLKFCQQKKIKTCIISGGFTFFLNHIKQEKGIDYCFANELEVDNGCLTGKIKGDIINESRKKKLLLELAKQNSIQLDEIIAIGDGANDIPMLQSAGLGIAFCAKEVTRKATFTSIQRCDFSTAHYFF